MMGTKLHSWFLHADVQSRAQVRLFCFPYAGGGASVYREWASRFPAEIEVCPVQLPGRESRSLEAPISSLPQIVQALVMEMGPLLSKPFVFFGHSMGALIAYETARQLSRRFGKAPVHLFVSGRGAPHLASTRRKLHLLPDDDFKRELRSLNGTPEAVLQHEELMQLLMPRLRADFEVCETYTYLQDRPLACPISVFGGTRDKDVSIETLHAWGELTEKSVQVQQLEGDHFFLHPRQEELIQCIKGTLEAEVLRPAAGVVQAVR
jgi:medium-chain acyl-[acyl-carrier-protein] hydrolase